jgi:glycosyltransferase involved in cell wall biosynthesis
MKILIYSHPFAPKIGGVETYVMLLAQGLAQTSTRAVDETVQVILATPTAADGMDDATLPFRVVRRPGFFALLRLVWGADVIHLAGPSFLPILFGLLLRKPVLVEHDGYQAACPNGLLIDERTKSVCPSRFLAGQYRDCFRCNAGDLGRVGSWRKLLLTFPRRWMCKRVAVNVCPSAHVLERVALPRSVKLRHGVPITEVAEEKMYRNDEPVRFAFVGRLVREKGASVLIDAARQLKAEGYRFHLKIIGDGPEKPLMEAVTDRYHLRDCVFLTGALHGDGLQEALKGTAVAIMPSTWEDVAPLAAIEHMMSGRLLIATDIGGLGELVSPDVGLKFPVGNVEALASCMKRVIEDPDLARMLGGKARERSLQLFGERRMVAEHFALYRILQNEADLLPMREDIRP